MTRRIRPVKMVVLPCGVHMGLLGRNRQRVTGALLALTTLPGCGTGATLTLRDGSELAGHVRANDERRIAVESRGRWVIVPKSEVEDIDHAGNGWAVAGAVFAAVGCGGVVTELVVRSQEEQGGIEEGGASGSWMIFTAPACLAGIVTGSWGYATWAESKRAAEEPGSEDAVEPVHYSEVSSSGSGKPIISATPSGSSP